ncbi:hypothetical protein [Aquimarina sp. Aq78]|uniref:hypothetical protein n=1 Tax=Aquimarina sp. Aq78 TaxID=1191889 RepID=UPI000D10A71D|nr:hypothetical protein [Aquimarina sp. Aq78]
MKLYKPLFSIIIIIVQLILSLEDYYQLQEWKKENPELDSLINLVIHYDTLFLFVLIIGIYEMRTKPSLIKKLIRILLVCIVFGYCFSGIIPIEDFKFGIYNTAWFSAVVAIVLILIQMGKYGTKKINKACR